jgi:peptidoglycan/xylan/chitin deacetylase (PgdA/CDA1 family)
MKLFLAFNFLFLSLTTLGQVASLCNWKDNKKAAIVLTFDDWLPGHEKIVAPLLIKKSVPGTFFITLNNVRSCVATDSIFRCADASNLEIANHTITHRDLTLIPFKEVKKEISTTRNFIRSKVPNGKSLTFAYPMGIKNLQVINYLKENHIAARGVSAAIENDIKYDFVTDENDYYKINTVRVWRILSRDKVGKWIGFAKKGGGLLTFMTHSVYNDSIPKGWDAINEKFFNDMCDSLLSHKKEVWLTTFEDAIQYHKEKASTQLTVQIQQGFKMVFSLLCKLDKNKFDEKLTIKIDLKDRKVRSVFQGGNNIPFVDFGAYILFDTNPFGEKITVNFKKSIP